MYNTVDNKETILFSKNIIFMQRVNTHLYEIHLKYYGDCKPLILNYENKEIRDSEYILISDWFTK